MGRAAPRSPRGAARALSPPRRSATDRNPPDLPDGPGAAARARRLLARAAALAVVAGALAVAVPASAAVLVSNIDQTASATRTLNGRSVVHEFTTGSNPTGYALTSVEVKFSVAPNSTVRVRLLQGGRDGSHAIRLTNPSSLATGNLTFTAPTGTTLLASTTYALAVDSATSGTLSQANTDTIDSGGAPGWSIATTGEESHDGGGSWTPETFEILFRVNGSPVETTPPTFVTAWVDGTELTLLFDEPLGAAALANDAFAVKRRSADGTESTVDLGATAPSVSGSTVVLTLASALDAADRRVTVAYTKPTTGTGNRIVDAAGNQTDSFAGYVADVLYSNIDQDTFYLEPELNGLREAAILRTGQHAPGYALAGVEIKFATAPNSSLRVRLFDTITPPGETTRPLNAIATLAHPPSLAAGDLRFTAPAGTTLFAKTYYAIVIDSATSGSINYTGSSLDDPGGDPGWIHESRTREMGGSWTTGSPIWQVRVSGTPNPVRLVSNIDKSRSAAAAVGFSGARNDEAAVLFTTGPGEAGYTLAAVDAELAGVSDTSSPKVSIHATSSGVPDGSPLHELTNPATVANGVRTFTAPAGATLDATTTYAVVFQQTGTSGSYEVRQTVSDNEDTGGLSGYAIADASHQRDAAAGTPAWTQPNSNTIGIAVRGLPEDRTAPTLVSGRVNGTKLSLTFSDPLGPAPNLGSGAFAVKKAGTGGTETDVPLSTATSGAPQVSGDTVVLTLTTALASADRGFKASYTQPTVGTAIRIVNEAGLRADSFSGRAVARALVSNLGQALETADVTRTLAAHDYSQTFTTGTSDAGYTLTSVEVRLATPSDSTLRVRILKGDDPDGTDIVATLTNPWFAGAADGAFLFTAPAATKLEASTHYTVVLDTTTAGTLSTTSSAAEDSGAAAGWSIWNGRRHRNHRRDLLPGQLPGVWTAVLKPLRIAVNGEPLTKPAVTEVRISSTPTDDADGDDTRETYGRGANIRVRVTFDKAVTVDTASGTPRLKIKMDPEFGEKWADYEAGSGTKALAFAYEVVAMNRSTGGIAVLENTLELNSGTIKDAADATIDANLAHPGRDHDAAHKVDGSLVADTTAPSFSGATVNGATLVVTFDEELDAASAPAGSAFAVSGGRAGTGTAALSGARATVTLGAAVAHGQTVTVSYTNPGAGNSPLTDGSGNEVASFSGRPVTNNTPNPGGGGGAVERARRLGTRTRRRPRTRRRRRRRR